MIFYNPFIITLFFCEFLIILFSSIGLFYAFKLAFKFDNNSLLPTQYKLAKKNYLVSTIVKFVIFIKIALFLFFIWTLDELANLLPGAMCAVGAIDATPFGANLLFLKIINLFLLSSWLYLNNIDFKTKNSKFTNLKFKFFIIIFISIFCEFILEILHFGDIKIDKIVACCSAIFKNTDDENLFFQTNLFILSSFFITFFLVILAGIFKRQICFFIFNFTYIFVSLYAIIRYFSPYIYELPTHKCPFCMIDKDYYFIGYIIYILLFFATAPGFFSIISKITNFKFENFWYKFSLTTHIILIILLIFYPISYFVKNGVLL